jgi:hypothetical protein
MLAADPDISRFRHRRNRYLGGRIFVGLALGGGLLAGQDVQQLVGVETGERQVEVVELEFFEFEAQQVLVPVCPGGRAVGQDTEGLDLRWVRSSAKITGTCSRPRCSAAL